MTDLFNVTGAGKSYRGRTALEDVSLSIGQGEVVCLLGPPKSGKSTLLRCLTLHEQIDRGSIKYGGYPVIDVGERSGKTRGRAVVHVKPIRFRRKFGYVYRDRNLFPNRTLLQNVIEGAVHVHRQVRSAAIATGTTFLRTVGLEDREGAFPEELTLGEQQRVALARAFMSQPELILLDEAAGSLDPTEGAKLFAALKDLHRIQSSAIIMVTHQAKFAADFAQRLGFLEAGRLVEYGPPREVLQAGSPGLRTYLESVKASW